MQRRIYPRVLIIVVGGVALAAMPSACSSAPSKAKKADAGTATQTATVASPNVGDSGVSTPPCVSPTAGGAEPSGSAPSGSAASGSGTTATSSALGGSTLRLDGSAPTYASIQSIVATNCAKAGCHDGKSTSPDLTAETGVDANASSEAADITSNKMPNDGTQLNDADKAALLAYLTDVQNAGATPSSAEGSGSAASGSGAPTSDATTGGTPCASAPSGGGTSSGIGTGSSTASGDPGNTTPGAPDSAVNVTIFQDDAVAQCHTQGKIYNRKLGACGAAAWSASFNCTEAGVLAAVGGATSGLGSQYQALLAKYPSYIYDQCGMLGTTVVVQLICPTPDNGTTCMTEDQVKSAANLPLVELEYACIGSSCAAL